MTTPAMFPIQRGAPIPWALAEIAHRTYARHWSQSLERLAERGGFGWHEFLHLYFGDADWKLTDAQVEERWKADQLQKVTTDLARVRGLLLRTKDTIYDYLCPVDKTAEQKDLALREIWNELQRESL